MIYDSSLLGCDAATLAKKLPRFERTYRVHFQMFRVREELDHEPMKMKLTF